MWLHLSAAQALDVSPEEIFCDRMGGWGCRDHPQLGRRPLLSAGLTDPGRVAGEGRGAHTGRAILTLSPHQKQIALARVIHRCNTGGVSKGTPIFTLRLPQKVQDDLAGMAKVYGSPNTRAFAREVLEVMCSADMERVKAFNARLIKGMGEQLTLKLNGALDASTEFEKPAQDPRKRAKGTKVAPRTKGGRK